MNPPPCRHCNQAGSRWPWPFYDAKCLGCAAREIEDSPEFWAAQAAGTTTPEYQARLRKHWGDNWKEGHARVKEWHEHGQRTLRAGRNPGVPPAP